MYNLSEIMTRAWAIFRKAGVTFAEALHRAWQVAKARPLNAAAIEAAKESAGVQKGTHTWADWKAKGSRSSTAARPCSGRP